MMKNRIICLLLCLSMIICMITGTKNVNVVNAASGYDYVLNYIPSLKINIATIEIRHIQHDKYIKNGKITISDKSVATIKSVKTKKSYVYSMSDKKTSVYYTYEVKLKIKKCGAFKLKYVMDNQICNTTVKVISSKKPISKLKIVGYNNKNLINYLKWKDNNTAEIRIDKKNVKKSINKAKVYLEFPNNISINEITCMNINNGITVKPLFDNRSNPQNITIPIGSLKSDDSYYMEIKLNYLIYNPYETRREFVTLKIYYN